MGTTVILVQLYSDMIVEEIKNIHVKSESTPHDSRIDIAKKLTIQVCMAEGETLPIRRYNS